MIDTPAAQIGAVITVLVLVFTFLKGDEPERVGAGAFALGWFASALVQNDGALYQTPWGLMAVDIVMLLVFVGLAWKSRRAWMAWICALQAIVVTTHIMTLVDRRPPLRSFYAVNNLAAYGMLIAFAVGAWLAWRRRKVEGLE